TIEGYGRIVDYENAVIKPDPTAQYKLLFHITTDQEREGVNVALWKIARIINLLENGGVPKKNIHVAAVVSGLATPIVLTKDVYLNKMGKPNPNLDLIDKLVEYGVALNFCGQAAAERDVDPETELNPRIKLTLSALIDIPTYQMQGYSIIF
ncbi:MAG: DsrE family protein, partial [Xanthomarina sp.]